MLVCVCVCVSFLLLSFLHKRYTEGVRLMFCHQNILLSVDVVHECVGRRLPKASKSCGRLGLVDGPPPRKHKTQWEGVFMSTLAARHSVKSFFITREVYPSL